MIVFMDGDTGKSTCLLLLCLLAAAGLCLGSGNGTVRCIESERQALLTFKKNVTDYGNVLSSWTDAEEDCCKWSRVVCDNQTGRVVRIDLRPVITERPDGASTWYTVSGEIASSLFELPYLTYLDLSNNQFSSIPSFIAPNHNLTYLNLSSNSLDGTFPYQLANLSALQYLDLSGNDYMTADSFDWLDHLSSLRLLKLSRVDFGKAVDWLQSIKNHPSLSFLALNGCEFPEINPSSVSLVNSSKTLSVLRLIYNTFNTPLHSWLFDLSSVFADVQIIDDQMKGPIPDSFGDLTSLEYLYLFSNQLEGPIPTSFRNLCSMKTLDLHHNNVSGSLGESLENLKCSKGSLQVLSLSNNQLVGSIPDITEFESLRVLNLDNNFLDGSFPETLRYFSKLLVLNVEGNQLVGSLPDFDKFPSLIELLAGHNNFSGNLSESIGNLSNLTVLDLSSNSLKGVLSEASLSRLSELEALDLTDNSISLNLSPIWVPPFQLDILKLRSCKLGPDFPKWVQSQETLSQLDISNSEISDTIPIWIWNFSSSIIYMNLSFNQISGQIQDLPLEFSNFPAVDLSSNLFHGPIPQFLSHTAALNLAKNNFSGTLSFLCSETNDTLTFLDLSDNQISGGLTDCWVHLRGLVIVNLEGNNLSGAIPSSVGSILGLQTLRLSKNNLTGTLPSSLQNCSELTLLDLGENKLSGQLPVWIGEILQNLIVLRLRSNEFYGNVPSTACHLKSLQIFDLAFNNMSGSIPTCLNNLTALVSNRVIDKTISYEYYSTSKPVGDGLFSVSTAIYLDYTLIVWKGVEQEYGKTLGLLKIIDLSSNNLIGSIPSEVTELLGLISLNLSRNNLIGVIPEEIGQLKVLEVLDLSHNMLSGKIPSSLADITLLSKLDLSNNNLTGRIPTSTQLQSFGSAPYLGNIGLCGCPLPIKCSGGSSECLDDRTRQEPTIPVSNINNTEEGNEGFFDKSSLYGGLGVGFAAGLSGFCSFLIVNSSCRMAYFRFLNKMIDWLYLFIALKIARRGFNTAR